MFWCFNGGISGTLVENGLIFFFLHSITFKEDLAYFLAPDLNMVLDYCHIYLAYFLTPDLNMILDYCHIYLESTSYLFENLFHTAIFKK